MPKAIIEFTLPEEQREYETAANGARYREALEDFRAWLRDKRKYSEWPPEAAEAFNQAWQALHDCLNDSEVSLD